MRHFGPINHMIRTVWTMFVLVASLLFFGTIALTIGLILPAQVCFNYAYRAWAWCVVAASGASITMRGLEHIPTDQNCFFVGNHQGAFDIPLLILATRGRVRFMAKESLFRVPFLGWVMSMHGCVPINRSSARDAKGAIDIMLERLRRKPVCLLVFPEGSRSRDGSILPFKPGSMNVCRRANMPVVPFAIEGTFQLQKPRELRVNRGPIAVQFGPAQSVETLRETDTKQIAQQLFEWVQQAKRGLQAELSTAGMASVAAEGGRA